MTHEEKETVFREYMPLIHSEAWRQVRRYGGCRDEFVQEASLAVWVAIDRFDESHGASMLSFLVSCIRWRFLTLHRRAKVKVRAAVSLSADVIDHRREDDPVAFEELVDFAYPHDRDLLRGMYRDGYTQQELGEQLHVSHQRVQQRAKRSLDRIHNRLTPKEMRRELRQGVKP